MFGHDYVDGSVTAVRLLALSAVMVSINYVTGTVGTPVDFVSFHAKGAPQVMPDGHVRMRFGLGNDGSAGLAIGLAMETALPRLPAPRVLMAN